MQARFVPYLYPNFDGEGKRTERLAELEPVVPLSRLCKARKFAGAGPIEFTWDVHTKLCDRLQNVMSWTCQSR